MDRLLVALLNTAREDTDPLETPLGAARWWSSVAGASALPLSGEAKPRFDPALAERLRRLRTAAQEMAAGGTAALPLAFTGEGSDAIVFTIVHAAYSAMESGAWGGVRKCRRQACGRYFLDRTKNRSRRWCSLRCMERARVPRRRTISR